ncbi:putative cytochrome P450 [Helianthus annuus]|nr:putative cytochrome P450 [Helianthus annuus]
MAEQNNNVLGWWEAINNDNELTMLVVTTSLLILAILWYKFILSNPSISAPPLPPGPRMLPIVGYLPFLTPNLHTQFTNMAHTYGPIFKLKLGSKLHVVINTPELAKEVVRDQDEAFSNRAKTIAASVITNGGQDIAFSDNNANWRKLRKISVHEMLSNKNIEANSSVRRDEVRNAIKNVFGRIGTKVNIREITFSTETSVLTRTIWESKGVKNNNLAAELDMMSAKIVQLLGRMNISDFFPILARFDLQGVERDSEKIRNKLDQLFTTIIDDRIESNLKESEDEEKKDFLQVLLNYKDEKGAIPLSRDEIKLILLDIMIAGTETSATTVEWAMSNIMQNHNIMKKIQEELVEIVGLNNIVEEYHLPKLKYMDATIKETLRMHPIVPFLIPRSPSKTCVVGGYTIPKGCSIFLNVWSIHHDPLYWDDPLKFNPERFLTNKGDYKGNKLTFFPFGSGRRLCPGIPLAEKMLMLILASLLHSFDWSIPKGEKHDLTEIFSIALKKRKPLIAIPSQRLKDVSLYM